MTSQQAKGERFAALHELPTPFIVPNPWDVGTARLLAHLGFEALATTGGGFAFSSGLPDGSTSRDAQLAYAAAIAGATDLPVTADLEDGFGDRPEDVHDTILAAARAGLVGGSIEDRTYGRRGSRSPGLEPYDVGLAVERIQAAADAARSLPFPFVVTARCENFLIGRPDIADTIRRLEAYQSAGADCLYAPGLTTAAQVRDVVDALDRPVNAIMGRAGDRLSLAELADVGVRRVSLGSTLARTALGAFIAAATELRDHGTCDFAASAVPHEEVDGIFRAAIARAPAA